MQNAECKMQNAKLFLSFNGLMFFTWIFDFLQWRVDIYATLPTLVILSM